MIVLMMMPLMLVMMMVRAIKGMIVMMIKSYDGGNNIFKTLGFGSPCLSSFF